ncbi:MAG: N-acetylneuraminate synthase family protein [Candidatus Omnitrophica bacterium]|nr:N-acetylneuraminate synthase family protein [Candidatus Omnitrophota bacterium]
MSIFIIAEIGINHNGDINVAKKLIDSAVFCGCDAVKFQKRTVSLVYSKETLDSPRESPWGTTTRAQKEGLEFGKNEYDEIARYCKEKRILWFASAWDKESQKFLRAYNLKYNKVASAMLTHRGLLEMIAEEGKHTFISTGMSSIEEIDAAVEIFKKRKCSFELLHANSAYPMKDEEASLMTIRYLKDRYNCNVGYSGHEVGLQISIAAVSLGISSLERHITLDRAMYGSDQAASVEIMGMYRLVRDVRTVEKAMGLPRKVVTLAEEKTKQKLRRIDDLLVTKNMETAK